MLVLMQNMDRAIFFLDRIFSASVLERDYLREITPIYFKKKNGKSIAETIYENEIKKL